MGGAPSRDRGATGSANNYGSFTSLPAPQGRVRDEAFEHAYRGYVARGFISRGWSSGLCDCFMDSRSCLMGCFCPCVAFGRNAEVLDGGQTACTAAALVWLVLQHMFLCGCAYSCWYRTKLRGMFDLPEEPCWDCCVHWLCFPCAVCQETREIDFRSRSRTVITPPRPQSLSRTCSF